MELKNGLSLKQRADLSGVLSKILADVYVLLLKTQNFHWNVHGTDFYALHLLAEEQYKEMFAFIDEIAERIRAMGFFVEGSMEAFLKLATIQGDHEIHATVSYLEALVAAHETVLRSLRQAGVLAGKYEDHGSGDLVGRLAIFHEKAAWMLRSQL